MTKPELKKLLSQHNKIKYSIKNLELDLEECDTVKSMNYNNVKVQTSKINNSTLDEVIRREEKREKLQKEISRLVILEKRIKNLTESLEKKQREVIQGIYFNNLTVMDLCQKLWITERTVFLYQEKAFKHMLQIVNNSYIQI